jgi:hypothetical protein
MIRFSNFLFVLLIAVIFVSTKATSQDFNGFFNFTLIKNEDKIVLEVDKLNTEFLYVSSLASGVGSNDLGLDRGKLNRSKVVKFVKTGNKILLIQPNYNYRATSNNSDEVKAVDDAFAISVLWGFSIEKEENNIYYVDATEFLMQDAANVINTLQRSKQGNYKLDQSRSSLYIPGFRSFPKNSEFEALLTFTGNATGRLIGSVSPTAGSVTVRQHHSFIELPDQNYKPRIFDPRAGYFGISYNDYAVPIDQPIVQRFINRHRLEKKNPKAKISKPIQPIIYYVDRGAPEPIKSALIEGASWWNQAFEAAGYKDAFIVKEMPEGADMLDVRYNVIQWVHRSTRGWSYGASIGDPRTGEILKGHVSLGSLRVRQDLMIAQGLLSPFGANKNKMDKAKEMALARIRQLSAHEVGHTIGLSHAYSSSSENRSSVMDYPHPLVKIINNEIDLSEAYDDKIGEWDKVSIRYGYEDFTKGTNEKEALHEIIQNSLKKGMSFLSDATSAGGVHPFTHQWDNGAKPYDELIRMMKVRTIALNNFGVNTIPEGTPFANLEDVLVPIYYFHRYQITAASKVMGGLNYRYALKGDGQMITKMISAKEQEDALNALLSVVKPESLAIPENLLQIIPPKPMGYRRSSTENIKTKTGVTFDPLSAAEALSNMVFSELTNPARAQRLLEYGGRNSNQPGLEKVLDKLVAETWETNREAGYLGDLQKVADNTLLSNLMQLAASNDASNEVKAVTWLKIQELKEFAMKGYNTVDNKSLKAHFGFAVHQIEQFEINPEKYKQTGVAIPPQGAPIGME